MKMRTLDRRTLLKGAGVAVGLPMLDAMVRPGRSEAAVAKRFIGVFESNGHIIEKWTPSGTETAFTLNTIHQPLVPHQKDLIFIAGLDNMASQSGPGSDHIRGFGSMLTGCSMQSGTFEGGGFKSGFADGISLDQRLAGVLGAGTKFKSLELGVAVDGIGHPETRMIFQAPGQPVAPQGDPIAVFARLFGQGAGLSQAALEKRLKVRKSVLDAVLADYGSLKSKLGSTDRTKVDAHLTSVREIEQRLDIRPPVVTAACQSPTAPTIMGITCKDQLSCPSDKIPEIGKAHMDLLVLAIACELTHVVTLQWGNCGNRYSFPWLGIKDLHHDLGHQANTNPLAREKLVKIETWYAEQFAYLLTKLKGVSEGSGTLYDNSLVLYSNELSDPDKHSHNNMPYIVGGRAGGQLKLGRFKQYGNVPHNNILVSCLNLMGVPATTFGYPQFCTGPLTGL